MNQEKKFSAVITGVGMYVPDKIMDNAYFEKIVDTSDEWIRTRTGIKERRLLEKGATSDLAAGAALDLLKSKNMSAEEIDVIIVATVTPDMFFPATACLVQEKICAKNAWGFDLSAACSGFLFAFQTGCSLVESGGYKKVMVIGADKMSSIVDYTDRNNCILFGDAGSAVLIEPSDDKSIGLQDSMLKVDGSGKDALYLRLLGGFINCNQTSFHRQGSFVIQKAKILAKSSLTGLTDG